MLEVLPVPRLLRVITFLIWLGATIWVGHVGMLRAYHDSIAHELIARRVVDSITPGIAQLGTVWLPLPPFLLLPFVVFDGIWRLGISGAIVGGIYIQLCAGALYRAAGLIGGAAAGWLAAIAFLSNPNVTYLFTTPLTEAPAFAFFCLCGASMGIVVEGLWQKEARAGALLAASAFAGAALLCRYDGWMMALLCAAIVLVMAWVRSRRRRLTEAVTLAYLVTPVSAVVLWLLYNLIIFGDALSFFRGQYSSAGIVDDLAIRGVIPTLDGRPPEVHRPLQALYTYAQAAAENLGIVFAVLALAGCMIAFTHVRQRPANLICLVLAAPFMFYLFALTFGQSVIVTRALRPNGIFNVRYGVMVAPLAAVAVAALIAPLKREAWKAAIPIGIVLVAGNLLLLREPLGPVVVAEGRLQQMAITATASEEAAHWFAAMPNDGYGKVLIDEALEPQAQLVLEGGGRHLSDYLQSSTPAAWRIARVTPPADITWIITLGPNSRDRPNDRVARDLVSPDGQINGFIPMFNNGEVIIYARG